jgi:hypothetical protein
MSVRAARSSVDDFRSIKYSPKWFALAAVQENHYDRQLRPALNPTGPASLPWDIDVPSMGHFWDMLH